jgi:hypothetical protein
MRPARLLGPLILGSLSLRRSTRFWSQVVIDTDSVDLAGHRVMGVAASGRVLAWGQVPQRRVTMPMIVLVLEIADDDTSLEQVGPMVAVEALPW